MYESIRLEPENLAAKLFTKESLVSSLVGPLTAHQRLKYSLYRIPSKSNFGSLHRLSIYTIDTLHFFLA